MKPTTIIHKPTDDAFLEMEIKLQAEILALSSDNDTLKAKADSYDLLVKGIGLLDKLAHRNPTSANKVVWAVTGALLKKAKALL